MRLESVYSDQPKAETSKGHFELKHNPLSTLNVGSYFDPANQSMISAGLGTKFPKYNSVV